MTAALAERGDRARRFGEHAPAPAPRRDAVRRRAGAARATSSSTCRPIRTSALVLASEGSAAPVAELSSDRARVSAALAAVTASARRADFAAALRRATQILTGSTARRSADLRHHAICRRPGWEDVTPALLGGGPARSSSSTRAAASRGATAPWSAWAPSPRPRRARRGSRWSPRSRTSPPSRSGTWASRCASTATRWRAGSSTCPRAAGRASASCTPSAGGAHQAEVVIDHDGFPLDDRRACRVEASRGLRVLLVDGDPRTVRTEDEVFFLEAALRAGGSNFSVTTVLPDDLANRDLAALRRRVPGQRRAAERHGGRGAAPATWRTAAACSSRWAIASTPTPGTRR